MLRRYFSLSRNFPQKCGTLILAEISEKTNGRTTMSAIKAGMKNFEEVRSSAKPVLIDFYADWCGPCKMVSPVIDEIADENPQYLVCKVNVDEEQQLAEQFGVSSIPTLVVMKNGEVVSRSTGAKPKAQILAMLEE